MTLSWLSLMGLSWLSLMTLSWLSVSTLAETALPGCGRGHGGGVNSALEGISKLGIKQAIGIS